MEEKNNNRKDMIKDFIGSKEYKPLKVKELAALIGVPKDARDEFNRIINELISSGEVIIDGKGRIKSATANSYTGIFRGTQRGFGFVSVEGEEKDIFISPEDTNGALDSDKVLVYITKDSHGDKSREGRIISILERNSKYVVGTIEKNKKNCFVIPDNLKFGADIYIPTGCSKGAVNGHKVQVEITDYGNGSRNPEGKVIEILGHINDPATDILSIVKAYDIPTEFSEEVLAQIKKIPDTVQENAIDGRLDLRSTLMVTIDGEDAKDLDDAVSLSFDGRLYHLGVHIADVSHYVRENSALDKEALKRGTSNYLVDSVIPMLPYELSNGICSLNMGVDRLALSCLMDIDKDGNVVAHQIAETVLNIDLRCDYTHVNKLINGEEVPEYDSVKEMLLQMNTLAEILRQRRTKRGSIDFDFPECKIITNERHEPVKIAAYERNAATRLIEDFMLIANETVAEDYFWQELPFVYRTHENPDKDKMIRLGIFINNFGYSIKMSQEEIHPKEIQKLLASISGTEEESLISRLTLRSLKQAKYTTTCDGHFGLAAKYYCHFTSPIRRYPDLQIHRIIKENLHGKLTSGRLDHYNAILPDVAANSSKTERRADEAEREVEKLKKIEYISKHIGEVFDGVISGVTANGLFVELPNTIEGLIKINEVGSDYFYFDADRYMIYGLSSGEVYKLGQRVKVRVTETDKLLRTINFRLEKESN